MSSISVPQAQQLTAISIKWLSTEWKQCFWLFTLRHQTWGEGCQINTSDVIAYSCDGICWHFTGSLMYWIMIWMLRSLNIECQSWYWWFWWVFYWLQRKIALMICITVWLLCIYGFWCQQNIRCKCLFYYIYVFYNHEKLLIYCYKKQSHAFCCHTSI